MFENKIKIYALPFVYVYTLSLGLIFLSVYLLVKAPEGTAQSYAQSEEFAQEVDVQIKLSQSTPKEISNLVETTTAATVSTTELQTIEESRCDEDIAYQIDSFFESKNAPLAGEGCNFHYHAKENEINPYIVAGIGFCESTGGKVTPQFGEQESYNAWGWAVYDSNDKTRGVNGYSCDSWEHCIGRVSRGIKRNSDKRDLTTEPIDVVKWYNPGSVDRAGGIPAEASWTKCVESTIAKMKAMGV